MNQILSNYQPINSYGVIGDCHSVVLISPEGSVDWGCLPDFDSPALFCRLLDAEQGGYFQIAPTDSTIPGSQRYLRGSNVLQTRFASTTGEIMLTDFMPVETLRALPYQGIIIIPGHAKMALAIAWCAVWSVHMVNFQLP